MKPSLLFILAITSVAHGIGVESVVDNYTLENRNAKFQELLSLLKKTGNGQNLAHCGDRKIKYKGAVYNGFAAEDGDWPWHAAISLTNEGQAPEYKCGGSLIHSNFILTAAHCVQQIREENILVELGRYKLKEDGSNLQRYKANKIVIHENYTPSNYANDIALISLAGDVTYNNYIQPVCLWFDNTIPSEQGTVIGFGLTANDKLGDVLNQASMPIVPSIRCLQSNRPVFSEILGEYNYCAGYRNLTSVCDGDSGGGMFFERDGHVFIRGVTSVAVTNYKSGVRQCDPRQYFVFTDVSYIFDWIYNHIVSASSQRQSSSGSKNVKFQELLTSLKRSAGSDFTHCGERKVKHLGESSNGVPSEEGDWPWHAALYHLSELKCGGTLIHRRIVLTAAHCIYEEGYNTILILIQSKITIRFGRHRLALDGPEGQDHQVHKIIVHDEYKPFNYAHDIALIRTVTDTPFSDYIQPACLWHDDTVPNDPGWVTGFSISHGDTGKSNLRDILSQAQMPIVSSSKCLKSNPDFFNTFMGKYNYCAGYRNGTGVCNSDGGAGMFFQRDGYYYLRGILSIAASKSIFEKSCDPGQYAVFTDTVYHFDWVYSSIQKLWK